MANVSKVAVSRLIAADDEEVTDAKEAQAKSRGDYKKLKELEEARKLGNAPAAVDEEGKDINPHIPQYISEAPWYLDPKGPTLKHQRQQEEKVKEYSSLTEWYKKGVDTSSIATKFRKGACENCGAITHKRRDCLERPRKIGAKFTSSNFAPDEFVQPNLSLTFDGKRDRWNGYDNFAHQETVEEFQKLEELKKEAKKERLKSDADNAEEDDGAPSSDEDEDKYVDKMDMPGTKVDAAERYTVRNLRIREDTAKYLRNLDPNSAYYDPKTRSMRKNPYENNGKAEDEVDYAGDNFVRISGDTINHAQSQMFSWEAGRKGLDVHALAEPTKLEVLKKEYSAKKEDFKGEVKNQILDKYGGAEYLEAPPKELIFAQTENYVEYTRHGQLIKGEEKTTVRSRFEEDVINGNHSTVWGSFWSEGRWGYKCCHSFLKKSYCTGSAGREQQVENDVCSGTGTTLQTSEDISEEKAEKSSKDAKIDEDQSSSSDDSTDEKTNKETEREEAERKSRKKAKKDKKKQKKDEKKQKKKEKKEKKKGKDFESEVAEAIKKQEEEDRKASKMGDERKRSYNNVLGFEAKAPTEAEMEAFYRKRKREEDPMAQFL